MKTHLPLSRLRKVPALGRRSSKLVSLAAVSLFGLFDAQDACAADAHHHMLAVSLDQKRLYHSSGINGDWSNINFKGGLDTSMSKILYASSIVLPDLSLVAFVEVGNYNSATRRINSTVYQSVRSARDGSWTNWRDYTEVFGANHSRHYPDFTISRTGTVVAAAIDDSGGMWYAFADARGWWWGWGSNGPGQWYWPPALPGGVLPTVLSAAIVDEGVRKSFHLAAVGNDGKTYHIKGTVPTYENPYPTWQSQGWRDLAAVGQKCAFTSIALAAETWDTLHLVGTGRNCQEHARRFSTGSWEYFSSVSAQSNDPGTHYHGHAFHDGTRLRVLSTVSDMYSTSEKFHIWETTRASSGAWTGIMDLNARQGSHEQFWIARGSGRTWTNSPIPDIL